jgi:flagellar biosynthesis/type III secretory pathway chaperone
MTMDHKRAACSLCRTNNGDRLVQIESESKAIMKRNSEGRQLRNVSIKEMSKLIDRLDDLKQERIEIIAKFESGGAAYGTQNG